MSAEERAKKLAQMQEDAEEIHATNRRRLKKHDEDTEAERVAYQERLKREAEEEDKLGGQEGVKPAFLKKTQHDVYLGTSDSMADRLSKRQYYRQKGNIDSKSFMKK